MPQKFQSHTPTPSDAYCPFGAGTSQVASSIAAAHLRQRAAPILFAWTQIVRRQATPAKACKDISFLHNSLPELLHNLADALENPHWRYGEARNNDLARQHGQQRQRSGAYTLDEMIDEYAVLRHVICENMPRQNPWPNEIVSRVHAFVDAAICRASREFATSDTLDMTRNLAQQRDDSERRAENAQTALQTTQLQRDDAKGERDTSRTDIAALLQEKQVRERVVALLSHDLRSPLTSIAVDVQRLERKPGDAALASRIAPRVLRAVHRIDYMVQDMLDASRLRAGQSMPIATAACDLVRVAAEAHEDLTQTYGPRIKLQASAQACGIWDAVALRRVIDNLVGNALKYGADETDVLITVADAPQNVQLTVHNHGPPLSEQEIITLFDPYVRSRAAETGEQRGWGLGLTLVRGVIEAHGGKVGASSSPEAGTIFWFELPKVSAAS